MVERFFGYYIKKERLRLMRSLLFIYYEEYGLN